MCYDIRLDRIYNLKSIKYEHDLFKNESSCFYFTYLTVNHLNVSMLFCFMLNDFCLFNNNKLVWKWLYRLFFLKKWFNPTF